MDSTKNNIKSGKEIDIRDAAGYLLTKSWIIILVTVCAVIFAFLLSSFTTDLYTSQCTVFILTKDTNNSNTSQTGNLSSSDFSVAIQLTKMSPDIFTSDDFAKTVAQELLADDGRYIGLVASGLQVNDGSVPNSFKEYLTKLYGESSVTLPNLTALVKSCIKITYDDVKCSVTLSATQANKYIATMIADAANKSMQSHLNKSVQSDDSVIVGQVSYASIPTTPSNNHLFRNVIIGAILGMVAICAILLAFYIFDDKIKTPDDIEKHLGLSVLGEIPEIEEEA